MAKPTEEQLEKLRTAIVEVVLEARRIYLREDIKRALKHWEQLQNRALSAARRASSANEWVTMFCRGLQLPALDSSGCSAVLELTHLGKEIGHAHVLALLERETGDLMAMARVASEQRRDAAQAAKEAAHG